MEDLARELLSDVVHDIWKDWMRSVLDRGAKNEDGSVTIQKELVSKWETQIDTEYEDLPEEEQDKDRRVADIVMFGQVQILKIVKELEEATKQGA